MTLAAITTRYSATTGRITASASLKRRTFFYYDSNLSQIENHERAAQKLQKMFGWENNALTCGALDDSGAYIFVQSTKPHARKLTLDEFCTLSAIGADKCGRAAHYLSSTYCGVDNPLMVSPHPTCSPDVLAVRTLTDLRAELAGVVLQVWKTEDVDAANFE